MQAWAVPPLNPPGEARLQDNLQRKGFTPPPPKRDGIPSATVEILGLAEDGQRLQAFRARFIQDLHLAFQAPPLRLGSLELGLVMADSTDPIKALRDQVLFTRGWCQAPQQIEAERAAASRRALGF
jgi:hypothetical protein